jgi:DNA-binding NarL/FixJ family response regulator
MLTTFNADESVLAALRAGAAGFLLKHSAPDDIIEAVHRAASGDPVFSPGALTSLVAHARAGEPSGQDPDREASARWPQLSDRQREVAAAVARGMSNTQIASELYLSAGTVKADISTALSSLGLTNRIQLAILAHRLTSTEPSSPESPA